MVFDVGLNALCAGPSACFPASAFSWLSIGNDNTPNIKVSGLSNTATCSGGTITVPSNFFDNTMPGQLAALYDSMGNVADFGYILTSSTGFPLTATWSNPGSFSGLSIVVFYTNWAFPVENQPPGIIAPQQSLSPLRSEIYRTNVYRTTGGDNGTTYTAGGQVTFKRTFINPAQASPYTVSELGWSNIGSFGGSVFGRVVLGTPDSVNTSEYYVVVMEMVVTYSPGTPVTASNVGTNINTAGMAMIEYFAMGFVDTSGNSVGPNAIDVNNSTITQQSFLTSTYSQQSSVSSTTPPITGLSTISGGAHPWTNSPKFIAFIETLPAGTPTFPPPNFSTLEQPGAATHSTTILTTTSGGTVYGLSLGIDGSPGSPAFDILLTTPFTLPTGVFNPTTTFQINYGRTLDLNS